MEVLLSQTLGMTWQLVPAAGVASARRPVTRVTGGKTRRQGERSTLGLFSRSIVARNPMRRVAPGTAVDRRAHVNSS